MVSPASSLATDNLTDRTVPREHTLELMLDSCNSIELTGLVYPISKLLAMFHTCVVMCHTVCISVNTQHPNV
jgi:hypothetical protein